MLSIPRAMLRSVADSRPWHVVKRELIQRTDNRFPALDGIRAMAALLVVYFHSVVSVEQTGGRAVAALPVSFVRWLLGQWWVGVDIFFVLSGFLIGRILLLQLRDGRIGFKAFYARRLFRIFPAYYVVLTASLFVFARLDTFRLLYGGVAWGDLLRRSPASYLYINNYVYGDRVPTILGWGWSLCVEEHFYLLFPLLLAVLFRRAGERGRLGVLMLLPLLPVAARALAFVRHPDTVLWHSLNWESHTHCDGLLLGVLIAYLFVYHHGTFARVASRCGPVLWPLGVICFASVFWWGGTIRPGFFAVVLQLFVLALGTSVFVVNGLFVNNWVSRVLSHPFWYPIARVSYGIYLIHVFAVIWLLSFFPGAQMALASSTPLLLAFATAAAVVAFVWASLLYFVVELPMLQRGVRLSQRPTSTAAPVVPLQNVQPTH